MPPADEEVEEERRSRSPVERIDCPPTIFRPPSRNMFSPPLTTKEIDALTNPNLPYQTGYTYANTIIYRPNGPDYYYIPNMVPGRYRHAWTESKGESSSSRTVYFSDQTKASWIRQIYLFIVYLMQSALRGAATGRSGILGIFRSLWYSMVYGLLTVLQYSGYFLWSIITAVPDLFRPPHVKYDKKKRYEYGEDVERKIRLLEAAMVAYESGDAVSVASLDAEAKQLWEKCRPAFHSYKSGASYNFVGSSVIRSFCLLKQGIDFYAAKLCALWILRFRATREFLCSLRDEAWMRILLTSDAISTSSSERRETREVTPLPPSVFTHTGSLGAAVLSTVEAVIGRVFDFCFILVNFVFLVCLAIYQGLTTLLFGTLRAIVTAVTWPIIGASSLVSTVACTAVSFLMNAVTGVVNVVNMVFITTGNSVIAAASWLGGLLSSPGWCKKLFWILLVPIIIAILLLWSQHESKDKAAESVEYYAKQANSIVEEYYKMGSQYSLSYWAHFKRNLGIFLAMIWNGFLIIFNFLTLTTYGTWSFMMDSLAAVKVDRVFQKADPPSPVTIYAAPPIVAEQQLSLEMQEKLVAAVVAKVAASLEERLITRMMAVEESVSKTKLELSQQTMEYVSKMNLNIDHSALDVMIREALRKYDADKTGQPDYALESAGGAVVSTRCSETYPLYTRVEKIYNIPLYYSNYSPRVVIQRNSQGLIPGECWAFKGGVGYLTVKLAHSIRVTAVSYEHISASLTATGHILSAPQNFSVFAYENDENDMESSTPLGSFQYSNSSEPLQFFPIEIVPKFPVRYIEMQVLSNWGEEEYTCLYRLRVHGQLIN